MANIIGRDDEKELLSKIEQSGEPELVALYVGAEELVKHS